MLEHQSATQAGLLTERTRQALRCLHHGRTRHVQAAELFCLDTFYIGKLKGVGKVWQITACGAASSYGIARILPELSATAPWLLMVPAHPDRPFRPILITDSDRS